MMKILVILILTTVLHLIEYTLAKTIENGIVMTRILDSKECKDDVITLCENVKTKNDVAMLACLQDNEKVMRKISVKCQHFLWDYKHKITTSNYFDSLISEQCSAELNDLKECRDAAVGYKVPCLLDHKEQIHDQQCLRFLDDIGVIIFSDYHLINKFMEKCSTDISTFKCGRIAKIGSKYTSGVYDDSDGRSLKEMGVDFADYVTSQSHTMACLIDSIQEIHRDCRHQIMRLAELQSDDYHLNRGLYLACREDRENLCGKVKSGDARVYKCLIKMKLSNKVSNLCQKELTRKQQVESMDIKANFPLYHSCKHDIDKNNCLDKNSEMREGVIFISSILICLHFSELNGNKLEPNCVNEIDEQKRAMLEDFKISPDALWACKKEAVEHCIQYDNEPAGVANCLMNLARPDSDHRDGKLSVKCRDAMLILLKAANPTDDLLNVDSSTREACYSSYLALCPTVTSSKDVFGCMIRHFESPMMAPKCQEKLTSLLYFISLDISVSGPINSECHADAVKLCNGPDTIEATRNRSPTMAQLEYHCMYQHYKEDKIMIDLAEARGIPISNKNLSLSTQCSQEIYNLIKAQASKVEIDPVVFVPCLDDIAKFCGGPEVRGKEHECLQTNIKLLGEKCRKAVIEFSQMEDTDYRLNRMIGDACIPMIRQFCKDTKPESVVECLEMNKLHPRMAKSCYIAIEHLQILSLQEYHIDHRFASFCGPEIGKYCLAEIEKGRASNKEVDKKSIVTCLSQMVTKKLLQGDNHPLSEECRRQFTFELLQRSESVNLDPALLDDCGGDITKYCRDVKSTDVNLCLRENQDKLSDKCHQRLFRRERLEALDADFDGELQQRCSQMINERCRNVAGKRLFQCLHRLMNEHGFDSDCKKVIMVRLERRMNDIRLNPGLIRDCRLDIKKYCHINDANADEPIDGIENDGKVILCLKMQYTNSSRSLHDKCRLRISQIIVEANTNLRLDPTLRKSCENDINEFCKKELIDQVDDPVDSIHNCLKHKLLRDELRSSNCKNEVIRLLREGRADVHVDLELFDACENTIMTLCRSETFGDSKKMNCLLSLLDDKRASALIEARCLELMNDRREMWAKVGNIETRSLNDLLNHVTNSTTKAYLLSMLGLIMLALVLLGIFCGRVTKRVAIDLKNK